MIVTVSSGFEGEHEIPYISTAASDAGFVFTARGPHTYSSMRFADPQGLRGGLQSISRTEESLNRNGLSRLWFKV